MSRATVTLQASPSVLAQSGDSVVVTWSGVAAPTDADWIAHYAPVGLLFSFHQFSAIDYSILQYSALPIDTSWTSSIGLMKDV